MCCPAQGGVDRDLPDEEGVRCLRSEIGGHEADGAIAVDGDA
jgi:hypothetical protein